VGTGESASGVLVWFSVDGVCHFRTRGHASLPESRLRDLDSTTPDPNAQVRVEINSFCKTAHGGLVARRHTTSKVSSFPL